MRPASLSPEQNCRTAVARKLFHVGQSILRAMSLPLSTRTRVRFFSLRLRAQVKCVPYWADTALFCVQDTSLDHSPLIRNWEIKEMAPAKGEECARAGCSCRTTSGKYCSVQCEAPKETPEHCSCGHAICMLSNWGSSHTLRTRSSVRP
jgi:hypothetical protein